MLPEGNMLLIVQIDTVHLSSIILIQALLMVAAQSRLPCGTRDDPLMAASFRT